MTALGLDIGTSGVKAVVAGADERVVAEAGTPIAVSSPRPGWSEQAPDLWTQAAADCLDRLAAGGHLGGVTAIGLSGQMLGPVLLDRADRPLRPAILWNDQRALAECDELLRRAPDIGRRSNGTPDPGMTAPKLLWLAAHEPHVVERASVLLLPKDYVRLWLTGERASEPSDAASTMLMDCARGDWDDGFLAAAGWSRDRLPPVVPSWAAAGRLRRELAARWGIAPGTAVAAGAADNMGSALGAGVAAAGDAMVSIGTSAVIAAADPAFRPAPEAAILTAPHAAPGFLSQAVVMAATAAFDWVARLTGTDVPSLAAEVAAFRDRAEAPVAVPALSGIRTPHNRPDVGATFTGATLRTGRAALGYAVMEGVAFQIAESVEAQRRAGLAPERFVAVGGGARSRDWLALVATLLGRPLAVPAAAPVAGPLGAARLARVAAGEADVSSLGRPAAVEREIAPDATAAGLLADRFAAYRTLLARLDIASPQS